ncbi:MAG: YggS family pyridoxal phosphate-dependent enzyme [Puniceicoccales bacterium]
MVDYEEFLERQQELQARVADACDRAGRDPASVVILPVTKTHPADAVAYAQRAGFAAVGENRVQEALDKMPGAPQGIRWELIGHLQSNKAKVAVEAFDRIQSVDSEKLLRRIDTAAAALGKRQAVLLQVNAGDDPAKFGVDCAAAPALLEAALSLGNVQVDGLMTIAPLSDDPDVAVRCFTRLRALRDALTAQFGTKLPELSMGMSGDLEAAIAAGSTMVRVGSALFGAR